MIKLLCATSNKHKVREYNKIASMLDERCIVFSLKDFNIDIKIVEHGKSFKENARIKVEAVKNIVKQDDIFLFSDDSGFVVEALDGQPGIYSARFLGSDKTYIERMSYILDKLNGLEGEQRKAYFVCELAMVDRAGDIKHFSGVVHGKIADSIRGSGGFGYDPIFIPDGYDKTFGEMNEEEKDNISHRKVAFEKLVRYLRDKYKL